MSEVDYRVLVRDADGRVKTRFVANGEADRDRFAAAQQAAVRQRGWVVTTEPVTPIVESPFAEASL